MTQIPEWLAKKAQEAEQKTKAKASSKPKAELIQQLPSWTEIERAKWLGIARSISVQLLLKADANSTVKRL